MRSVGCVLAMVVGLAAPGLDACRAEEFESPVKTEVTHYDVCIGKRKVGHMRLKVMSIKDLVILDEEFVGPFKIRGKTEEAGFESQVVFRGTDKPMPVRGKVTTSIGTFKLMEGSVEFKSSDTGLAAKAEATGYADVEKKPFDTPRTWEKEIPAPGDLFLTHAAMLLYAPKLLPRPGKIENVTQIVFPANFNWPALITMNPDCVLERHPTALDGTAEITLHRVFVGGNIKPLIKLTVDAEGKVVEFTFSDFVLRPVSILGDSKPADK